MNFTFSLEDICDLLIACNNWLSFGERYNQNTYAGGLDSGALHLRIYGSPNSTKTNSGLYSENGRIP